MAEPLTSPSEASARAGSQPAADHHQHASGLISPILTDSKLLTEIANQYILALEEECPDFTRYMEEATSATSSLRRLLTLLLNVSSPTFDFRRSSEFHDFSVKMKLHNYEPDTLRVAGQVLVRVLQQVLGVQTVSMRVSRALKYALTKLFEEVEGDTQAPSGILVSESHQTTSTSVLTPRSQGDASNLFLLFSNALTMDPLLSARPGKTDNSPDPITVNSENLVIDNGKVTSATFPKIIECLTSIHILDMDVVLLTYRSYSTPEKLLEALVERFEKPVVVETSQQEQVRYKVLNVLKRWVRAYWADFARSPAVVSSCVKFLERISSKSQFTPLYSDVATAVVALIRQQQTQGPAKSLFISPTLTVYSGPLAAILESTPVEDLATQITILDWILLQKIRMEELHDAAWMKKDREKTSPNVIAVTDHFNWIAKWVKTSILTATLMKDRVKVTKKFIQLAYVLREKRNFNGVMAVLAGLDSGPVYRLKKTWDEISAHKKYSNLVADLRSLSNPRKNYIALREAFREDLMVTSDSPKSHLPVIPYLGMFLSDLVFIDEGNPSTVGGRVNVVKAVFTSNVLQILTRVFSQTWATTVTPNGDIQGKILSAKDVDEETLYDVSNYIEPKEGHARSPNRPPLIDRFGIPSKESRHARKERPSNSQYLSNSYDDDGEYTDEESDADDPELEALLKGIELSESTQLIGAIIKDFEDKSLIATFTKHFFPVLFSSVEGSQDAFESRVGTSETMLNDIITHTFQFLAVYNIDRGLSTSENFRERGQNYALLGITEEMFAGYNTAWLRAMKLTLGNKFTYEVVGVWSDFLEEVKQALFDVGEEEEFLNSLKMSEQNEKPVRVAMSMSRRKLKVFGPNMALLYEYSFQDITQVISPMADKPNSFMVIFADEKSLRFFTKNDRDLENIEGEFKKRVPREKVVVPENQRKKVLARKRSSSGKSSSAAIKKKKNDNPIANAVVAVMESPELLSNVTNIFFQRVNAQKAVDPTAGGLSYIDDHLGTTEAKRLEFVRTFFVWAQQLLVIGIGGMEKQPILPVRAKIYAAMGVGPRGLNNFSDLLGKSLIQAMAAMGLPLPDLNEWTETMLAVNTEMVRMGEGAELYSVPCRVYVPAKGVFKSCTLSLTTRIVWIGVSKQKRALEIKTATRIVVAKDTKYAFELHFDYEKDAPFVFQLPNAEELQAVLNRLTKHMPKVKLIYGDRPAPAATASDSGLETSGSQSISVRKSSKKSHKKRSSKSKKRKMTLGEDIGLILGDLASLQKFTLKFFELLAVSSPAMVFIFDKAMGASKFKKAVFVKKVLELLKTASQEGSASVARNPGMIEKTKIYSERGVPPQFFDTFSSTFLDTVTSVLDLGKKKDAKLDEWKSLLKKVTFIVKKMTLDTKGGGLLGSQSGSSAAKMRDLANSTSSISSSGGSSYGSSASSNASSGGISTSTSTSTSSRMASTSGDMTSSVDESRSGVESLSSDTQALTKFTKKFFDALVVALPQFAEIFKTHLKDETKKADMVGKIFDMIVYVDEKGVEALAKDSALAARIIRYADMGVTKEHLTEFTRVFITTLKTEIGSEFTDDYANSWAECFVMINDYMAKAIEAQKNRKAIVDVPRPPELANAGAAGPIPQSILDYIRSLEASLLETKALLEKTLAEQKQQ